MIRIPSPLIDQLIEYCGMQLPNEACGMLFGSTGGESIYIHSYQPIANAAAAPRKHFEFEQRQFTEALFKPRESKWIGIFHSHPASPAFPSAKDLLAHWQLPVYVILSFANPGKPVVKSYAILADTQKKPNSALEQTVEIIRDIS